MSSAARSRIEDEPDPAPEDPRAKAGRVLDAHLALIERADALLGSWRDACPQDSLAVPALRELITETIGAGLHAEEMRQALAAQTATAWTLDAAFAAGRAAEREAREAVPVPGPGRHAAERGGRRLKAVRDLPVAAFAGAAVALRHAWAAHPAATAAAGATVATLAAATAVVAPHAAATFGVGGSSSAPNPAASVYSAVPVTGPSIAMFATKPKGGKGSAGTLTFNLPPSVPSYAPQGAYPPPGSGNGQNPSQPSSLPASAPDVRLVVTSALDLGAGSSGMIRLAAYGGAVSWSASTSVAGLTLDSSSGTLSAGDAATVTVTIGADLQALTGPGSVTITYGDGKTATVPVAWTVIPLPVPTVVPTDVLPSALPTIAGV